ncbi:bifunctional diguanylate cyclase/phosphodiesterase [Devosia aurantiaca]|nr:EAL domain-containing protein [Devosia aurantiaca]
MRSLFALSIAALVLVVTFSVLGAVSQNRLAIESSRQLAATALEVKQREIARNLEDYAYREDSYRNLHADFDYGWASASGNLGSNIFANLGYEMAFVISPDKQTLYATVEGQPQSLDAFEAIGSGLLPLVQEGAQRLAPAVGMLRSDDSVLLVAATAIRSPEKAMESLGRSDNSVLVFAKRLNGPLLTRIGSDYLLNRLRLSGPNAVDLGASLPLQTHGGEKIGQVTWVPEQPGYENLRTLLPLMGGCFLVFGLFAFLAMRYARRSSKELQSSARTIDAYSETLKKSEARFRDVAEASSDWIWECDKDLAITFVSARFGDVTGHADKVALGSTIENFFAPDFDNAEAKLHWAAIGSRKPFRDLRCSFRNAAGEKRICRVSARPIVSEDGQFQGYRGTAADITEEVEAQARAVHLSLHDLLTGLPNRALFRDRLQTACDEPLQQRSRIAVLCIDLDHFKHINDTLGHAAGDLVLQQVTSRLRQCVNATDTVARLGGDEFTVIQYGSFQPLDASVLGRRIIEKLSEPYLLDDKELFLGASIGIALVGEDGDTPTALLKNADIALYRAKQAGRGTARRFEPFMDQELRMRRSLEHDMRQAIAKDQLVLHYQPLVQLHSGEVVGVEALVRWNHPERGLVPPNHFIPLAEDTGLILSIGEWVLRTACQQAAQWPGLVVAVNLSPVQFKSRDLVETVSQILRETGLPPGRLELEITESVLLHDSAAALAVLERLKAAGVRIAMDDFGTGYSSLGYLNSFPFDKIKIDQSFIRDLDAEKSNAIVRSVVSLGQSLKMITTAEGVETVGQAEFLRQVGCEQVQGYLYSRPLPAEQLAPLLLGWVQGSASAA